MNENILGTEKIGKLFIKYSIPAILSMIIAGMQSIIDGLFVGNFVGSHAMASVNIAQPFFQLIIGSSFMICMGALSIIGRRLGEQNTAAAKDTFRTATVCTTVATVTISLLGVFFNEQIATLLGASDLLLDSVATYIFIISLFAPFMAYMFLFGFINRMIGSPMLYLISTFVSIILNVSLNFIFIKVLGFGIAGAAFATGMSYLGGLSVVILPVLKRSNVLNIFEGRFSPSIIGPMLYNGSSEAVTSIATALTAFLFNITFMQIAGEDGVAAFTTISYISQFAAMLMFGVADGVGPIISYNYGNGRFDRVNAVLRLSLIVNFISGIILFVILFIFGGTLVSAFAGDNQVVLDLASNGAKLYAFAFFMNGFNIMSSSFFTALGKAKESVLIAGCRGIVGILFGILVLPQFLSLTGVWLTVPFAEVITLILAVFLLLKSPFSLFKKAH